MSRMASAAGLQPASGPTTCEALGIDYYEKRPTQSSAMDMAESGRDFRLGSPFPRLVPHYGRVNYYWRSY